MQLQLSEENEVVMKTYKSEDQSSEPKYSSFCFRLAEMKIQRAKVETKCKVVMTKNKRLAPLRHCTLIFV